jgi:hypothetical protein
MGNFKNLSVKIAKNMTAVNFVTGKHQQGEL